MMLVFFSLMLSSFWKLSSYFVGENTHTKKIMLDFFLNLEVISILGSASTGSTKSATMELYTSSYNETMSGGGETLSSISEKSCISSANHNGQNGTFPTQAYLMVSCFHGFYFYLKKNVIFYIHSGLKKKILLREVYRLCVQVRNMKMVFNISALGVWKSNDGNL